MEVYLSHNSNLADETRAEIKARNTHKIGGYSLFVYRTRYRRNGYIYKCISVLDWVKDNVEIYSNSPSTELKMTIQTTSWGALPLEEMRGKMEAYQRAIETLEWINTIDWESVDILNDYD